MTKVLLIDDERELREEVAHYLRNRGCEVTEAGTLQECRLLLRAPAHDIVIVDRMLPDGDGLDLADELRQAGSRCGIVVFTARDASKDRIDGYQRGADHYVTKPIRLDELSAVIDTLSWRVKGNPLWRLQHSDWTLHTPQGRVVRVTAQELGFLTALAQAGKKVMSRQKLADHLGKDLASYEPRNLDALVLRLRKKVAEVSDEAMPLKAVHGTGYMLTQTVLLEPT